jgi:hypothetical protein
MSLRWIATHPLAGTTVVFLPSRRHRQLPRECRRTDRDNRRVTAGRVSGHRDDQTARLVVPPTPGQFLLCRIHHAVQIPGHHADHRLVPSLGIAHTKVFEQGPDAVLVAVRMLAAEAPHRIELIRLEVGRAGVQFVGMLLNPRAGDVVLT